MPALNFQARFAYAVESGEKRQTIRKQRKRPIKPDDTLHLYTGMRTRACRKLGEVRCKSVWVIYLWFEPGVGHMAAFPDATPAPPLKADEYDDLAHEDGFDDAAEMGDWFEKTHGLPFEGVLIRW